MRHVQSQEVGLRRTWPNIGPKSNGKRQKKRPISKNIENLYIHIYIFLNIKKKKKNQKFSIFLLMGRFVLRFPLFLGPIFGQVR